MLLILLVQHCTSNTAALLRGINVVDTPNDLSIAPRQLSEEITNQFSDGMQQVEVYELTDDDFDIEP